MIQNKFGLALLEDENINLMKNVFETKKVPLEILGVIKNYRDFHSNDYQVLKDTVRFKDIKDFNFYFDYVLNLAEQLLSKINIYVEPETQSKEYSAAIPDKSGTLIP